MDLPNSFLDHPIAQLSRQVAIVAQLHSNRLAQQLEPFEITPPQFAILNHLMHASEPQTITQLADAVEVQQPAVTKVIKKFEARGLVSVAADESDKRARRIVAEDALGAFVGEVYATLAPDAFACFEGWEEAEIAAFTTQLARYAKWLDGNRLG